MKGVLQGKEQLLPPPVGVSLSCPFHLHWSWAVHESEVSATPLTERSFSVSGFLAQALVMGGRGVVNKGSEIVKLPCFTGPRDPGPKGGKMNTWEPALKSGDKTTADGTLQLCAFLGGQALSAQCLLQEAGWGEQLRWLD